MHTLCAFVWLVVYVRQRVGGYVHSSIFFAMLSISYNFRWQISSWRSWNFRFLPFVYSFASFAIHILLLFRFCRCCCCCCWVFKFFSSAASVSNCYENRLSLHFLALNASVVIQMLAAGSRSALQPVSVCIEGRSRLPCPLALDWVTGVVYTTFTSGSYSVR